MAPGEPDSPLLYERIVFGLGWGARSPAAETASPPGASGSEQGGGAAAAPGGGSSSSSARRRQQLYAKAAALEARPAAPGTKHLAAALGSPTHNMTAQERNKARRQADRQQRRAAKAAGDAPPAGGGGAAGDAAAGAVAGGEAGVGSFEAHTRGIGTRLLTQMGWSPGEGLGKRRHGRAAPLQAERRPRQLGLGYE
jgi:hypothetical protein